MSQDTRTGRIVAVMMVITVIGKAMGLLRDRLQAVQFGGDTVESIAFAQASVLPRSFLDIMFAAAFSASFIPVFSMYLSKNGKQAAFNLASLFISAALSLAVIVTVVGMVFAGPIFSVSLGGGHELPYGTLSLGTTLLRYMLPLIILSVLAFSFAGMLQSMGEFRIPAAMSIVSNTVIIVYYFFLIEYFGVHGLAIAFLVGWGMQVLVQLPFLIKHKFWFRFKLNLRDEGIRQIAKLALPVMASTWVLPVNLMVNARAAATGAFGGEFAVNAIYFANSLVMMISGVFVLSVANVVFPKLAKEAHDMPRFTATLTETLLVLIYFLVPLKAGMLLLGAPLVELVLGGGMFGTAAVEVTSTAFVHFSIGVVFYGIVIILGRACFAQMDGRTPLVAAVVAIVANAVLSFGNIPFVASPAVANSIALILCALILFARGTVSIGRTHIVCVAKMLVSAAVMVLVIRVVYAQVQDMQVALRLIIPTGAGLVLYLALTYALGLRQALWLLGRGDKNSRE